jgi:beta-hydroxyacyl-ACP dehydratase FabZ
MNSFGIDRIMKLLPHRYPFLLVDKVLENDNGQHQIAVKNVTMNEPFFQGHFPGYPVLPGVLQIEMLAQAGGIMILSAYAEIPDLNTLLTSVETARFRRQVSPGDQLLIETTLIRSRGKIAKIKGVITVDGEVTTEATLTFMLAPKNNNSGKAKQDANKK